MLSLEELHARAAHDPKARAKLIRPISTAKVQPAVRAGAASRSRPAQDKWKLLPAFLKVLTRPRPPPFSLRRCQAWGCACGS